MELRAASRMEVEHPAPGFLCFIGRMLTDQSVILTESLVQVKYCALHTLPVKHRSNRHGLCSPKSLDINLTNPQGSDIKYHWRSEKGPVLGLWGKLHGESGTCAKS